MSDISEYSDLLDTRSIIEHLTDLLFNIAYDAQQHRTASVASDGADAVDTEQPDWSDWSPGQLTDAQLDELAQTIEDTAQDTDLAVEARELTQLLRAVRDIGGDSPEDGRTLIRDSYFEDHVKEEFVDTSDTGTDELLSAWPYRHIDWSEAADEARQDYTEIEYRQVAYWTLSQ